MNSTIGMKNGKGGENGKKESIMDDATPLPMTKQEADKETIGVGERSTLDLDGGLQVPYSNGQEKNGRVGENGRVVKGKNVVGFAVGGPEIGTERKREACMTSVLDKYRGKLTERTDHFLGYPCNLASDYSALARLQHFSINNVGDPFIEGNYGIHSKEFEVGVLNWFAKLWGIEEYQYWGYITSGGTEGNMHGILVGRKKFPNGILYTSRESHYSVFKIAEMYRMECVEIKSLSSGAIDCMDFETKLLQNKDKPAIVNVNIGSTVKGAIDDLDLVIKTLRDTLLNNNNFYIHCDAALFGMMLPFVKQAPMMITFKKPIGSVSVSGHKFMGCPMPCGIYITRMEYRKVISGNVEYLSSKDTTIMGSRNGLTPVYLWYSLNRKGYKGFQKDVEECLKNAQYLKDRLRNERIGAMRNKHSPIVVFECPQDAEFVRKWQLSCHGNIAHVVVMPHVTVNKLKDFMEELVQKRLSWFQDGKIQAPCIAEDIGQKNCACSQHCLISRLQRIHVQ